MTDKIRIEHCDRCNARSQECDRAKPQCTRCINLGIVCTYALASGITLPPVARSLLQGQKCKNCIKFRKFCDKARPICGECATIGGERAKTCSFPTSKRKSTAPQAASGETQEEASKRVRVGSTRNTASRESTPTRNSPLRVTQDPAPQRNDNRGSSAFRSLGAPQASDGQSRHSSTAGTSLGYGRNNPAGGTGYSTFGSTSAYGAAPPTLANNWGLSDASQATYGDSRNDPVHRSYGTSSSLDLAYRGPPRSSRSQHQDTYPSQPIFGRDSEPSEEVMRDMDLFCHYRDLTGRIVFLTGPDGKRQPRH